jgi:ABC-type Na+ efflux pump permease subunit
VFRASFKKEIKESIRRYRFLVLIGLLLLFAIAAPVVAKLMPKLLGAMESNSDAEGLKIIFSREPNVFDGFFQYIKNLNLYPFLSF